jgi:Transposase DDE domain
MVRAARADLDYAGVTDAPQVVLADAGYWHQIQMERLMSDGVAVLIPPDANKRKGQRPGWQGGLYDFMRGVLDSERGGELYAHRQTMVEPVFGHTKFNRRCDRFLRRGRSACRSEWRLITATNNMLKLWKQTTAPATI